MPSPKKKVTPVEETPQVETTSTTEETPKVETTPVVKRTTPVIFESVDGKKMFVSINDYTAVGNRIEAPREIADEVERVLKIAKYLFTKIA